MLGERGITKQEAARRRRTSSLAGARLFVTDLTDTALGRPQAWRWSSGDRAQRSFDADTRIDLHPPNLGNKLIDLGITSGVREYPQSRPATGSSAPWAR